MKNIIIFAVFVGLTLFCGLTFAGGYRVINNYYITEITENYIDTEELELTVLGGIQEVAALTIASSNINFDYGTYKTQLAVGLGKVGSESSAIVGIAKRGQSIDAMFSATFARVSDHNAIGIGATWRLE